MPFTRVDRESERTFLARPYTMRPLLPTLRNKRRYIAFRIVTDGSPTQENVWQSIQTSMLEHEGTRHYGKQDAALLLYHQKSKLGILRVAEPANAIVDMTLIQEIEGKSAIIRTIKTSGMIGKLKKIMENNNATTNATSINGI